MAPAIACVGILTWCETHATAVTVAATLVTATATLVLAIFNGIYVHKLWRWRQEKRGRAVLAVAYEIALNRFITDFKNSAPAATENHIRYSWALFEIGADSDLLACVGDAYASALRYNAAYQERQNNGAHFDKMLALLKKNCDVARSSLLTCNKVLKAVGGKKALERVLNLRHERPNAADTGQP